MEKLLTEKEVAVLLRVHPDTVARERSRGNISFTRIGSEIRYTTEHIAEYIKRKEVRAKE